MGHHLDPFVGQRLSQHAEPIQGVHPHAYALTMLMLGKKDDQPFRATYVERVQHVVDLPGATLTLWNWSSDGRWYHGCRRRSLARGRMSTLRRSATKVHGLRQSLGVVIPP